MLEWLKEKKNWMYYSCFLLCTAGLIFMCFYRLDVAYVDSWDEARHGVNAYEMMQNGSYLTQTFNYQVDYWNSKPPLSFYGIMLGFRLFGYSVFGLRFYSAAAYVLTGLACAWFLKKYNRPASLLVLLMFCTNALPFKAHLVRAGDADSLYLLFFTLAMLAMFSIREKKNRLYVCGLCFGLAFLTKSWHAGMIAAIGGLYLLLTGEIRRISFRQWLIFIGSFAVPVGIWAAARFLTDGSTFFTNMLYNDLLNRASEGMENHAGSVTFYWDGIFGNTDYSYPFLLAIWVAGLLFYWKKWIKGSYRSEAVGGLLWFLIPFAGFSLAGTKLIWYGYPAIIPVFVGASLLAGTFLCDHAVPRAVRMGAGILLLCLLGFFIKDTYVNYVRDVHGEPVQEFMLMSADREGPYAGADAYLFTGTERNQDWEQSTLFLAEICGDYHCMEGGIDAFLAAEEKSVLYILRTSYEAEYEKLKDLDVLHEAEPILLIGK